RPIGRTLQKRQCSPGGINVTHKQETLTARFFWWGWYTDRVESWLEEKAAQGWRLVKADRSLTRFHFVRDQPKKVRICADYQAPRSEEYEAICKDAGWELVAADDTGWYLWRMEYSGFRPE